MKISRWGASSLVLAVAGLAVGLICTRWIKDARNLYLIPYILLEVGATACGIAAVVRGSKWWILVAFCAVLLAGQASLALFVE
jgi:hypothetical protein